MNAQERTKRRVKNEKNPVTGTNVIALLAVIFMVSTIIGVIS